ncbi:hypothetical protein Y032_0153g2926 [Ancylostoma ceylanicum]|uniref:Uncharacterized protein n=1 Tax=Ancylostoma ceylanicum TaxID=53326 RepID=A0A016T094_9BILA|nr:hypothetical protein Y032_0153g2926 [Ancylostoma ceylanicum]
MFQLQLQCASMAVTHPRPRQGRRATAPHVPESMSLAVGVLFLGAFLPNLVIYSLFSCFIRRSTITAANNINSDARGAVARRALQGREWVTAIDAYCTSQIL